MINYTFTREFNTHGTQQELTSENSSFRSSHPTIPPPLAGWSSSSHPKQNFAFHTCPMSSTLIPFLDRIFGVGFAYANGWDEESGFLKLSGKKQITYHINFWQSYMGVSKNRVPQNGWFIMENLNKKDDLGVPPFKETPIYLSLQIQPPENGSQR